MLVSRIFFQQASTKTGVDFVTKQERLPGIGHLVEPGIGHLVESWMQEESEWLRANGFPDDFVRAVQICVAELNQFCTSEDVRQMPMGNLWELLQTTVDRRQWLAKIVPPSANYEASWPNITKVAKGLGVNKGQVTRLVERGDLRDNKKTGTSRRIDPASVLEYCDREGITYNDS